VSFAIVAERTLEMNESFMNLYASKMGLPSPKPIANAISKPHYEVEYQHNSDAIKKMKEFLISYC
jgi:hypothetical protein